MINETVENGHTDNAHAKYHCEYYDVEEFQKITHTLTQNVLAYFTQTHLQYKQILINYIHYCTIDAYNV